MNRRVVFRWQMCLAVSDVIQTGWKLQNYQGWMWRMISQKVKWIGSR